MSLSLRSKEQDHCFRGVAHLVDEYEFTAPQTPNLDERTHSGGRRIFKGEYGRRGAYAPEAVGADDLTWNGIPIDWNGEPLQWDD